MTELQIVRVDGATPRYSTVTNPVTGGDDTKKPVFMQAHDVKTANEEDAKKIGEFLSSKEKRQQRQDELQAYLMGMGYEEKEAKKLAKSQVENEMAQANAKRTVVFIDEKAYNDFVAQQPKDSPYKATLIKDKEVLEMIRGERLVNPTPEEKEEHLKKFYKTDEDGNLVKDENGQYIFDSDKYKTEMEQDVTAYRLTLKDRAEGAEKRGYDPSDEKNAIIATGMDWKFDKTWLGKGIFATVAILSAIFGGSSAHAESHATTGGNPGPLFPHGPGANNCGTGCTATAIADAKNYTGNVVGGTLGTLGALTYKDRDDAVDSRKKVNDLLNPDEPVEEKDPCDEVEKENEELKKEIEELKKKIEELETDIIEIPPEVEKCYSIEKGVEVAVIKFGGYSHYASLYSDCETGKPLTQAQIRELTELLMPGHPESSIQRGENGRVLRPTIKLKDGTEVCLADEDERARRIANMKTESGGGEMKLDGRKVVVTSCDGLETREFESVEAARRWVAKQNARCIED